MGVKRIVIQYDMTGHPMREFPSYADAARHVGGLATNIYNCCVGRCPTAYGFRWRFKDDEYSKISDLEYSMIMERAYSELTTLIMQYKKRVKEQMQIARDNGETEPYHLRLVVDALQLIASDFRKRSDDSYKDHKKTADEDETGCDNLKNAVIERMVMDYEHALVCGDEETIRECEEFAARRAHHYTDLNTESVLERVREGYAKFKPKAHDEIYGIIETTELMRKKRDSFSERYNPHRCPLCGCGMYIKTKLKANSYLVGCSGCELTEVVTTRS